MNEGAPHVHPLSHPEWYAWLADNHATSKGAWFVLYKKATGKPRVEYDDAVSEALCWGWIDSVTRGLDDERSMYWFSPRKKGSGWSQSNKLRLEVLEAQGRIQPAGRAVLDAAMADGSWTKLDDVETRTVPEDLLEAFAGHPGSQAYFDAFPSGEKRRILEWIVQAKTPATRQKRLEETARLAQDNVRANLWTKKEKP